MGDDTAKGSGCILHYCCKNFFTTIPESLSESAKLDGANDITILYKIFIPLSKPIISVLVLFYAVMHWNSYFDALIYLAKSNLQPLQLFLVRVLVENDTTLMGGMVDQYERGLGSITVALCNYYCSHIANYMRLSIPTEIFCKGRHDWGY